MALLVTDQLPNSCLVNLIDVTLTCEDANSKLVEVVTVADVDAEKRVDDSLMQILKLKFGNKVTFFQTLSTRLVKILKLQIRQDFEAEL